MNRPQQANRSQLVLSALASVGPGVGYTPVQVQKIFFLLDRRGGKTLGGPYFDFQPYDYGPFDHAVYHELDQLEFSGFVSTDTSGRYRRYVLTDNGYASGTAGLQLLPEALQEFIRQTVEWVRQLRFEQLVAAIYREYPEMRANSVFNQ